MSEFVSIAEAGPGAPVSDAIFWEEWLGDDVDTLTLLEEAELPIEALFKHMPGRHDQQRHDPHKGAGTPVTREWLENSGLLDSVDNVELRSMISDAVLQYRVTQEDMEGLSGFSDHVPEGYELNARGYYSWTGWSATSASQVDEDIFGIYDPHSKTISMPEIMAYREDGAKVVVHELGHHVSTSSPNARDNERQASQVMSKLWGKTEVELIDYGLRPQSVGRAEEFMADAYMVNKAGNVVQKRNLEALLVSSGIDSIEDVYKQLDIQIPVQEIRAVRNGDMIEFVTVDVEVDPAVLAAVPWYYIIDSELKHLPGKHNQKLHDPHKGTVTLASPLGAKFTMIEFPEGEYKVLYSSDKVRDAKNNMAELAGTRGREHSWQEAQQAGYRTVKINDRYYVIHVDKTAEGGANPQPAMRPLVANKASMGEAFPVDFPVTKTELRHSNENMNSHFAGKPSPAQGGEKLKLGDIDVSFDRRSKVKDAIVKDLTQRMKDAGHADVNYDDVNETIRTWAHTSNDESVMSLHVQKAAEEEFGVKMSEWQQKKLEGATEARASYVPNNNLYSLSDTYKFPFERAAIGSQGKLSESQPAASEKMSRDFLRGMYDHTQSELEKSGVEYVTLYRGMRTAQKGFDSGDVGKLTKSNAMESWSTDIDTAKGSYFTGGGTGPVYRTIVPRERILCTSMTGFGCLQEYEVIVLGNQPDDVVERVQ